MSHHHHHRDEEVLELLWTMREENDHRIEELVRRSDDPEVRDVIGRMEAEGLLLREEDGGLRLTATGDARARTVIRRHRLAERLFVDLFDTDEPAMESGACEFEHILSADVIDRVCSFLGHPPRCPHGKVIPPGECCSTYVSEVRPVVSRLADLEVGARGRVTLMAPGSMARMDRLSALGVVPGVTLRVRQRRPAFIVEVDQTVLAIDPDIAADIFVKRAQGEPPEDTPKTRSRNPFPFSRRRKDRGDGQRGVGKAGWGWRRPRT